MFTGSSTNTANVTTSTSSTSTSSLTLWLTLKDIIPPIGHSLHNLNQNSTVKDNLRTAWLGVESLLQKAERLTAGTPFQSPFALVNVLIELGNVCSSLTLHATFADNSPRPLSIAKMR